MDIMTSVNEVIGEAWALTVFTLVFYLIPCLILIGAAVLFGRMAGRPLAVRWREGLVGLFGPIVLWTLLSLLCVGCKNAGFLNAVYERLSLAVPGAVLCLTIPGVRDVKARRTLAAAVSLVAAALVFLLTPAFPGG